MSSDFWERFFSERDSTGRELVISSRTGRKYCIEPIGLNRTADWNGYNEQKDRGSIDEKDSLITPENGFINITKLEAGLSPYSYIDKLDEQYPDRTL